MSKKYIVLGATGGVGSAVVRALSDAGHSVHMVARDMSKLETLADQTGSCSLATCDAAAPETVAEAVSSALDDPIDGLIYAIGSVDLKPLKRVTSQDMTHAFTLNVTSALTAIQTAAPRLKEAHGSVLLFSSVAATLGFSNHAITGTVKAGVEGLTKALAAELSPEVRVNAIAPSLLETPMSREIVNSKMMAEAISKAHPLGRLGQPNDVMGLVHALLQPGIWVTGQVFGVDGGRATIAGR